jgi:hypothetical protein
MIDNDKIKEWKDKYKFVYKVNVADQDIVFKTLTRDDYIAILTIQAKDPANFDHDVEVFQRCVLTPYDLDDLKLKAGITTVVAEKIMILSGFEMAETEEL